MNKYKDKVNESAKFYNDSFLSFDFKLTEFNYLTIKNYFKGKIALELGPAIGQMTKYLVPHFDKIHVVEGSKELLEQIPKYTNIIKHHSYFEEFKTDMNFDTIIMGHVLEHIEYPVEILKLVYKWLADDGVLVISVPNAKSLHRLAAVKMGLLGSEYELNERDHELGHYRVYDLQTLKRHAIQAGFKVFESGGIFLKPVSNKQIETNWDEKMINGFYKLGKSFPQNGAEIFIVCIK
jgi:2-polyprenyl-3-methyl-5-hydroxy-6-metoxy-1,4-benzoquinol methylase